MKRILILLLTATLIFGLCSCADMNTGMTVPDVLDVEEDVAKNIISTNGLIPNIKYEYSDTIEEGHVIKTTPSAGASIVKNSKVDIIISKGAKRIDIKDGTIGWYHIGNGEDEWEFNEAYIEEGTLNLVCKATFAESIEWKSSGFGNASINDTFSKTVPVEIEHESTKMAAGTAYDITLQVPVNDLDVSKPTTMYLKLVALKNGKEMTVNLNFSMTW